MQGVAGLEDGLEEVWQAVIERRQISEILSKPASLGQFFEMVESVTSGFSVPPSCFACDGKCCVRTFTITRAEFEHLKPSIGKTEQVVDRCPLLGPDNRCTVYEKRPLECRMFNVVDRVIKTECPEDKEQDLGDEGTALREVLYLAQSRILGKQSRATIAQWLAMDSEWNELVEAHKSFAGAAELPEEEKRERSKRMAEATAALLKKGTEVGVKFATGFVELR